MKKYMLFKVYAGIWLIKLNGKVNFVVGYRNAHVWSK